MPTTTVYIDKPKKVDVVNVVYGSSVPIVLKVDDDDYSLANMSGTAYARPQKGSETMSNTITKSDNTKDTGVTINTNDKTITVVPKVGLFSPGWNYLQVELKKKVSGIEVIAITFFVNVFCEGQLSAGTTPTVAAVKSYLDRAEAVDAHITEVDANIPTDYRDLSALSDAYFRNTKWSNVIDYHQTLGAHIGGGSITLKETSSYWVYPISIKAGCKYIVKNTVSTNTWRAGTANSLGANTPIHGFVEKTGIGYAVINPTEGDTYVLFQPCVSGNGFTRETIVNKVFVTEVGSEYNNYMDYISGPSRNIFGSLDYVDSITLTQPDSNKKDISVNYPAGDYNISFRFSECVKSNVANFVSVKIKKSNDSTILSLPNIFLENGIYRFSFHSDYAIGMFNFAISGSSADGTSCKIDQIHLSKGLELLPYVPNQDTAIDSEARADIVDIKPHIYETEEKLSYLEYERTDNLFDPRTSNETGSVYVKCEITGHTIKVTRTMLSASSSIAVFTLDVRSLSSIRVIMSDITGTGYKKWGYRFPTDSYEWGSGTTITSKEKKIDVSGYDYMQLMFFASAANGPIGEYSIFENVMVIDGSKEKEPFAPYLNPVDYVTRNMVEQAYVSAQYAEVLAELGV